MIHFSLHVHLSRTLIFSQSTIIIILYFGKEAMMSCLTEAKVKTEELGWQNIRDRQLFSENKFESQNKSSDNYSRKVFTQQEESY